MATDPQIPYLNRGARPTLPDKSSLRLLSLGHNRSIVYDPDQGSLPSAVGGVRCLQPFKAPTISTPACTSREVSGLAVLQVGIRLAVLTRHVDQSTAPGDVAVPDRRPASSGLHL